MRNLTKDYNDPPYRRYATTLYPRQMMILMLLVENARKNVDVEVLALNKLVRGVRPKMMVVALDGYTVYTCDLCLVNVSVILLKRSKVLNNNNNNNNNWDFYSVSIILDSLGRLSQINNNYIGDERNPKYLYLVPRVYRISLTIHNHCTVTEDLRFKRI